MIEGKVSSDRLNKIFPLISFFALDAGGRLGGMVIGYTKKNCLEKYFATCSILGTVEAPKFVGNNSKGFSPNQPSQLARYCLVWGIRPVCGPATVGQSNKNKGFTGCGSVHRVFFVFLT